MTEVLLLGSFHFMESSIDFYCEEVQNELDVLVRKFLPFQPDTIAIEAADHEQIRIDESYAKFCLKDLQNRNKMKNEALGNICMYGENYPITYDNEVIQIGYRLGKMLELQKIYAIDDDTRLNMDAMDRPTPSLTEAMNALHTDMKDHEKESIVNLYQYYNGEKFSKLNHHVYIQANAIHTDDHYTGAEMVAKWYERNLKIFSNIQRLAVHSKRLFVIYGAGHLQILRELINADNNLKLADVSEYLSH